MNHAKFPNAKCISFKNGAIMMTQRLHSPEVFNEMPETCSKTSSLED